MLKSLSKLLLGIYIILTLSCGVAINSQRPNMVRTGYIVETLDDYVSFFTWSLTPWYRTTDHEGMMPVTVALIRWGNGYAACIVDPAKEYIPYGLPYKCKSGWRLPR